MALAEDLEIFLADFGVPVSFDGAPSGLLGIQDIEGAHIVGGSTLEGIQVVSAPMKTIMLRTADIGNLTIDPAPQGSGLVSVITVNGVQYVIRDIQAAKPDGVFTVLALGVLAP